MMFDVIFQNRHLTAADAGAYVAHSVVETYLLVFIMQTWFFCLF